MNERRRQIVSVPSYRSAHGRVVMRRVVLSRLAGLAAAAALQCHSRADGGHHLEQET